MLRVYGCIAGNHDIRLVLLAGLLCFFSCYTAFSLIARARQPEKLSTYRWIFGAALVTGCGIWATHFIAMLGFQPGLPVSYDVSLTILSALIAVVVSGLGFALAIRKGYTVLGGAMAGVAISAMHYVGMAAVRMPAQQHWDAAYVAASLVIGIGFGAAALAMARHSLGLRGQLITALLFTLGICGMHFTGMAALSFTPDPTIFVPEQTVAPLWFAVAITAVALLIVGLGLIGALVDKHVAQIEASKKTLQSALLAADAANLAKSQFLATMSHELRTPLNAVIGFSEILKEQLFGPIGNQAYRGYAEDIFNSGTHLLGLINDVLDLSKLDAGHLKLNDDIVDLNEVVRACMRLVRSQADRENVRLLMDCATHLPHVRADARRLHQVLINLLSNAIKFTPEGGRVCISTVRLDDGLTVAIADTGIGIAKEDVPKALARFGQIDSTLSRKYEGTGLGLPLAKQLVELHGGTLSIESAPEAGTTVTAWFPEGRILSLQECLIRTDLTEWHNPLPAQSAHAELMTRRMG